MKIWIASNADGTEKRYIFYCPACRSHHGLPETRWHFNGNFSSPTFHPSFIIREANEVYCHGIVEDGKIKYLNDSKHEFAGKIVDMDDED